MSFLWVKNDPRDFDWEALQYKHLNRIFLFYLIVKPQNKLFSLEFTSHLPISQGLVKKIYFQ